MSGRGWALGVAGVGLVGGLALLLSRSGQAPAPAPGPTAAPEFVGSAACSACHAAEVAAWRDSDHARAMLPPAQALGAFTDAALAHHGEQSRFLTSDGAPAIETRGPDGVAAPQAVRWLLGVDPLQQVLLALDGGRLQAHPAAWDARPAEAGGQRWFALYPTEARLEPGDPLHWTGRLQNANAQCVECHTTRFQLGYDAAKDTFRSTWLETGVGCEACHGPGSAHVAWAQAPGGRPPVGLPNRLARPAGAWVRDPGQPSPRWKGEPRDSGALDACWTCHALRHGFSQETRPTGRFLDRFQPRLLDAGAYYVDGQILGEVFEYGSFTQSKMHAAGVQCADCHEPHGQGLRAQGNALCTQCHDPAAFDVPGHHHHPADSPGASCVACHMPARVYMELDARRDHRLGVPRPDLAQALGAPDACRGCHTERALEWASEQARALWPELGTRPSFGPALAAGRAGAFDAVARLTALAGDAGQPAIARATALTQLPGLAAPEEAGAAIALGVADPEPLVRIGALRALEAVPPQVRWRLGAGLLRDPLRAVRIDAARELAGLAPADADPGDLRRAVDELIAAEEANAARPESHLNLANLWLRLERPAQAEAALRTGLVRDPGSLPLRLNLADVLRATGRDAEGETLLRESLALSPTDGPLHHALGLLLVRTGRKPEALTHLRAAVEHAPDVGRYAFVLAAALRDQGALIEAASVLHAAHQRRPGDLTVHWALVETLRDAGDRGTALPLAERLAQRLPSDSRARALLASLQR